MNATPIFTGKSAIRSGWGVIINYEPQNACSWQVSNRNSEKEKISYRKSKLSKNSSKFEVENTMKAEVHTYIVFKYKRFNFIECDLFPQNNIPFCPKTPH